MANLPNTYGPEWAASQASPWVQVNLALRALDSFAARAVVQTRSDTAPPVTCDDGALYLIASTATGDWAGEDGNLAVAIGANAANGWHFIPAANFAREGVRLEILDEAQTIRYDGASWVEGRDVFVDMTGAVDGGAVRYDQSNDSFYIG